MSRPQLTAFEQATVEQLVSFKAANDADISRLLTCEKVEKQAVAMVAKWDQQRIQMGLEPWNV